jgi:hypothetical protein
MGVPQWDYTACNEDHGKLETFLTADWGSPRFNPYEHFPCHSLVNYFKQFETSFRGTVIPEKIRMQIALLGVLFRGGGCIRSLISQ